jgi:hypothetical protein
MRIVGRRWAKPKPEKEMTDIDQIIDLDQQIAELKAQQQTLIASYKKAGAGKYQGKRGVLTISVAERKTLDMKAVRAKLSPQFITAHTKLQEVISARITKS